MIKIILNVLGYMCACIGFISLLYSSRLFLLIGLSIFSIGAGFAISALILYIYEIRINTKEIYE